jgi:hypothetical protein
MARRKRKLSEDAALEIALNDHPEWRKAWRRGELPDEIVGEDGEPMSPRAHLHIHAIVERQLAGDDPKGVAAIAAQLQELGLSKHDIRHEIGCVIASHMWYVMKEGAEFDEKRYLSDLQKVVQSHR